MTTDYHAEHVGSLLRPPWLLEARASFRQGGLTAAALRELQDRAALEAIEIQRQAGMKVFTDGEMRRDTWMAGLLESIGGVVPAYRAPAPCTATTAPLPPKTPTWSLSRRPPSSPRRHTTPASKPGSWHSTPPAGSRSP
jgi:5-methyltetrahydropteroyltriglutamate--homocysteine methyltransferase